MKKFDNKVILVTGGSCGISRATALAFAQKEAKVVIVSRRIKALTIVRQSEVIVSE